MPDSGKRRALPLHKNIKKTTKQRHHNNHNTIHSNNNAMSSNNNNSRPRKKYITWHPTLTKLDTQECVYGMAQHVQSMRDVEAQQEQLGIIYLTFIFQARISDHRRSGWDRFVQWFKAFDQRNQVSSEELLCLMFQTMNWNKQNASGEEGGVVAEYRTTTIYKLLCALVGSETTMAVIEKGFVNADFCSEWTSSYSMPSLKMEVNVNKALYLAAMKYNNTNNNKQGTVELDCIYTLFRKQQSMIQQCRAFLGKIQLGADIKANGENKKVTFDEAVVETIVRHFSISRMIMVRDEKGNATQFWKLCDGDRSVLFRNMCHGIGRTDIVLQMLEDTIQRSSSSRSFTIDALMHAVNKINDPHYDTMVHLDCFYFLLRREPTLFRHVRSPSSSSR